MYRNNINPKTINNFFEDFFHNGLGKTWQEETTNGNVPVNIKETDKHYDLSFIAPGLQKEDFKVNIDRNVLTVSFEPKEEATKEDAGKWLRKEFKQRAFKRSFTLNEKIDTASITAKYTDGILTLNLPKKEQEETSAKDITVG